MRRALVPGGCPPALGSRCAAERRAIVSGSKTLASSAAQLGQSAVLSRPRKYCDSCEEPPRRLGSGGPRRGSPGETEGHQGKLGAAPAVDATAATMALASAKSSALEDNNKAVATGMKWSIEARAEIPQAMRDEIEAEMATKRV